MYNLYRGNSGTVRRVGEQQSSEPESNSRFVPSGQTPPLKAPPPKAGPASLFGSVSKLGELLPNALSELETEDILLLLVLYLMYRESGDSELLIIMGAMFLL